MSLLDPELFSRRDPHEEYDMSLETPLKAQHVGFTDSFGFIIMSCQEQLSGRPLEELEYAVEFLNWLMNEADNQYTLQSIDKLKGGRKVVFETDPRKLLALFEDFDLEDQKGFPNATPEDYFAVLALAKCYEAIETHERLTAYGRGETTFVVSGYPDDLQDSLYHNAIRARDSLLSEAKDLVAFIDGIRFAQLRSKSAGKRGATAKSTPFVMLREKLMSIYDERYQNRTNRQAANLLYQEFRDEVEQVLRTDDPAQRIGIWIGQHKKKNSSN